MIVFVVLSLLVEPLTTSGTVKPIESRMLRFVVLLRLYRLKHFTTIFARKSFPRMTSHVQVIVVAIIISLPTNATEVGVLSSVMLGVLI